MGRREALSLSASLSHVTTLYKRKRPPAKSSPSYISSSLLPRVLSQTLSPPLRFVGKGKEKMTNKNGGSEDNAAPFDMADLGAAGQRPSLSVTVFSTIVYLRGRNYVIGILF